MAYLPSQVTLSYPKPRESMTKIIPIARTDSSTLKAYLPKDAVISAVRIHQTSNAVTGAGGVSVGIPGNPTGIVNAFSLPTTSVGIALAGTAAGPLISSKFLNDAPIIVTYVVGTSTAGGVGFIHIDYVMAGPGEAVDD